MSFTKRILSLAFIGVLSSAGGAFAQAGGADVPGPAKAQGAKQNGPSSAGKVKTSAKKVKRPKGNATKTGGASGQPGRS